MDKSNLPDFMSYKDKFTNGKFVEKISRIAKRAGVKLVYAALILYYTLESDKVSRKDKAVIIGALGYLISPLDVIPDAIPIAGLSDDLAVLIYVLHKVWVESRSHSFLVAVDGRSEKCAEGTRITLRRAPYNVQVVKRSGKQYFSTLREKMMWGADVR